MNGKFVIIGTILIWCGVFGSAVYAASQGAKINLAHAFIIANLSICCWFLLHSAINLCRVRRPRL